MGYIMDTIKKQDGLRRILRDGTLFAAFSLLMLLAGIMQIRFRAHSQEYHRNMCVALKQCATMLQNGEKDALSRKINALLESEIFTKDAPLAGVTNRVYAMGKSFRETLLSDSPETKGIPDDILLYGLLIWGIIWSVSFCIWMLLYLFRAKAKTHLIVLTLFLCFSLLFMLAAGMGSSAMAGYYSVSVRHDLQALQKALTLPVFPPEMLEQLKEPQVRGGPYCYLSYRFDTQ